MNCESRHIFYKIDLSTLICHFCEYSMIAHAALVLKDAFAAQFASIQAILDSGHFQVLAAICYLLVSSLLCFYSVK